MGLPDFTPRLMELQAQVARLTHDRELLIKALEDLVNLEDEDHQGWQRISIRNAIDTLARVRREDNFLF